MRLSNFIKKSKGINQPKSSIQVEEKEVISSIKQEDLSIKQHFTLNRENDRERANLLYGKIIKFLKYTLEITKTGNIDFEIYKQSRDLTKEIIKELLRENDELLIVATKSSYDNYLLSHLANVTIFSERLGLGLGYSQEKLEFLGISAMLHDIGTLHIDLAEKPTRLKERNKFVNDLLNQLQSRERDSKFEDKEMQEIAKIIGLLDVYEGLTHPRKFRERKLPHEVLKMFIETSDEVFENSLVKKLIEELSIYPPGSFVKLNSEEIGQVVRVNKKFPTRPVVEIVLDNEGNYLSSPKYLDLSENAIIQIKEAVNEDKLNISDKKFMMKLKLNKWWIE
jgi:HD-GYP domain-containing protein (c-di-GMP phosphodiesterase class II)